MRYTLHEANGLTAVLRVALQRSHGRWTRRPDFYGRTTCNTVRSYKLLRPVFGGSNQRKLGISVLLTRAAQRDGDGQARGEGGQALRGQERGREQDLPAHVQGQARGDYKVTIDVRRTGEHVTQTLTSRRL